MFANSSQDSNLPKCWDAGNIFPGWAKAISTATMSYL